MGKSIRSKHKKALRTLRREQTKDHNNFTKSFDACQAALEAAAAAPPLKVNTGLKGEAMEVEAPVTRGRVGRKSGGGATGMEGVEKSLMRKGGGIVKKKGRKLSKVDTILADFKASNSKARKRKGAKIKH